MSSFTKDSLKSAGCALLYLAIAMLIFFALSLLLGGCRTKYIATEPLIVHERDSIYKVQQVHTHDTLRQKDSVVTYIMGDTLIIERWHDTQVINHINRVDTLTQEKEKEVPVPYPQPYPVEKELSWWQKLLMWLGGGLLAVGGWKLYRRFKP